MKVGFVVKKDCDRCALVVRKIEEMFPSDWTSVYDEEAARLLDVECDPLEKMTADMIITVGGDGTVLRTINKCDIPVLGINMGKLGFLSEVEIGDIERSISKLVRGDYEIEESERIKVSVNGKVVEHCTNEVVIHTNRVSKIRKFGLYVNGTFIDNVAADGMIVATPIGSTSYAYSTGGPILSPKINGMVVSYIAPFNVKIRPMVVSEDEVIHISLRGKNQDCILIFDGHTEYNVTPEDDIRVSVSEKKARFVTLGSFYERMRRKLLRNVVN